MARILVVTLASLAIVAHAAPASNRVTAVPGFAGPLGFESWAGYVAVDESPHTKHMFYWLVGSARGNYSEAPTVLWLTGGPGCSSLFAFTTEHGPLRPLATDPTKLEANPFSWNNAGVNIIYLESPVGVGFSWAEDGNYTAGDNETARVAHEFLLGLFYDQFPELLAQDVFIAGESYAVSLVRTPRIGR
jgi:carboxypeptidase C (cathepsin A)